MHTNIHTHMHNTYIYIHTCMYVYMHTLKLTYIHTHYVHIYKNTYAHIYRVSQKEWTKLRESVPYVELYRYNPNTYIQS